MYLIFTVYDVNIVHTGAGLTNLDALLIAEGWCDSNGRVPQLEAGKARPYCCDTGVIVWKWPQVLPLVTCSSVMVTSHCWPFLYNYPCYLSNWHCLSLALAVEV